MSSGRRTWAVLGEMLELGESGPAEHEAIGQVAAELGIDRVVTVGAGVSGIAKGVAAGPAGTEVSEAADPDAARRLLEDQLAPGDVVLVKASRGVGLDVLAQALLHGPANDRDGDPAPDDRGSVPDSVEPAGQDVRLPGRRSRSRRDREEQQ
jgi:UDP-N-acetylmuramoyl-tripeptide--D-alanyl-D-alanine ligase